MTQEETSLRYENGVPVIDVGRDVENLRLGGKIVEYAERAIREGKKGDE